MNLELLNTIVVALIVANAVNKIIINPLVNKLWGGSKVVTGNGRSQINSASSVGE